MKFKEIVAGGSTDSKNYLRLKDKESAKGLFVGDPYEFKAHWNGKSDDICTEDNICSHCALDQRPRFRFRINFIVKESNEYITKVFEQGLTTYERLKELNDGEYNLDTHLVTISRSGSTKDDTKYSILPVKNGELKPDQLREILKAPLHDLKHKTEDIKKEVASGVRKLRESIEKDFTPEPAFDSDEEIPF